MERWAGVLGAGRAFDKPGGRLNRRAGRVKRLAVEREQEGQGVQQIPLQEAGGRGAQKRSGGGRRIMTRTHTQAAEVFVCVCTGCHLWRGSLAGRCSKV